MESSGSDKGRKVVTRTAVTLWVQYIPVWRSLRRLDEDRSLDPVRHNSVACCATVKARRQGEVLPNLHSPPAAWRILQSPQAMARHFRPLIYPPRCPEMRPKKWTWRTRRWTRWGTCRTWMRPWSNPSLSPRTGRTPSTVGDAAITAQQLGARRRHDAAVFPAPAEHSWWWQWQRL